MFRKYSPLPPLPLPPPAGPPVVLEVGGGVPLCRHLGTQSGIVSIQTPGFVVSGSRNPNAAEGPSVANLGLVGGVSF